MCNGCWKDVLRKDILNPSLTDKSHFPGHCAESGMVHWDSYNLKAGGRQEEEVTQGRREEVRSLQSLHLPSAADSGREL